MFSSQIAFESPEEIAYWFTPIKQVITSYVVENENGDITDFFSFYTLNSTICNHPVHKKLYAAYSFYNFATTVSLEKLLKDALIVAKREGKV